MGTRGIRMERVIDFFKDSNLDVAKITLKHVTNIVRQRKPQIAVNQPTPVRKPRKRKESGTAQTTVEEHESLANA